MLRSLGSFKSSVKGCEASLSRLFSAGRMVRTSSLPLRDVDAAAAALSSSSWTTTRAAPGVSTAPPTIRSCAISTLLAVWSLLYCTVKSHFGLTAAAGGESGSRPHVPLTVPPHEHEEELQEDGLRGRRHCVPRSSIIHSEQRRRSSSRYSPPCRTR
jgi:hypothetical protein